MKYTLLAIIVACVVLFIASGCAVYYPTSYRAFIPKQWDSEYKEYKRLCRENIGKVVYARPITQEELEKIKVLHNADKGYRFFSRRYAPVSKSIYERRISLHKDFRTYSTIENSSIVYQMIFGYAYDRYWTKYRFFHKGYPAREQFLECEKYVTAGDLWDMASKEQHSIGTKNDVRLGENNFLEFAKEDNNVR